MSLRTGKWVFEELVGGEHTTHHSSKRVAIYLCSLCMYFFQACLKLLCY